MRAYVDSSVMVAIAFGEPRASALRELIPTYERIVSSPLLEAEISAAFRRENRLLDPGLLSAFKWVTPQRALTTQLARVFAAGYLKGGDAWHVACVLYATDSPAELAFLTLDSKQRDVAAQLGFPTP